MMSHKPKITLLLLCLLTILASCRDDSEEVEETPIPTATPIVVDTKEVNPLIYLPGVAGSSLVKDSNKNGIADSDEEEDEVWVNISTMISSLSDDYLSALELNADGRTIADPDADYQIISGEVIDTVSFLNITNDLYGSAIDYLTASGYVEGDTLILCDYDWRLSVIDLVAEVDKCIAEARKTNDDDPTNDRDTQVDILAHSMGGLISRYYISDANRAKNIEHFVSLGTPFLGAPKLYLSLVGELCMVQQVVCLLSPEMLAQGAVNFPSIYQIAPSEQFFEVYGDGYLAYDEDGDGLADGIYTLAETKAKLKSFNANLAEEALQVNAVTGGWANGGTNGVEVAAVAGYGLGSITTVLENADGTYTVEYANGDGTVPLHSADMQNEDLGVDLSGGIPVFYVETDHETLAKHPDALNFAVAMFSQEDGLATPTPQPTTLTRAAKPLNGQSFVIKGDVQVEVVDTNGRFIGYIDGETSLTDLIADAVYNQVGDNIHIFVPDTSDYTINVYGNGTEDGSETSANVVVNRITDDVPQAPVPYAGIPVQQDSRARLEYTPPPRREDAKDNPSFELDRDGDGELDGEVIAYEDDPELQSLVILIDGEEVTVRAVDKKGAPRPISKMFDENGNPIDPRDPDAPPPKRLVDENGNELPPPPRPQHVNDPDRAEIPPPPRPIDGPLIPPPPRPEDCPVGEICEIPSPPPDGKGGDCPSGEECEPPPSSGDGDCPPDEECEPPPPEGETQPPTSGEGGCPAGEECEPPPPSSGDGDCPPSEECEPPPPEGATSAPESGAETQPPPPPPPDGSTSEPPPPDGGGTEESPPPPPPDSSTDAPPPADSTQDPVPPSDSGGTEDPPPSPP